MAEITKTCTNEEKLPFTIAPLTAKGNPAAVENATVEILNGEGKLEFDPATNSGYLISSDTGGVTTYRVTADADLGEGVVLLSDDIVLITTTAQATSLGINFGAAEAKA